MNGYYLLGTTIGTCQTSSFSREALFFGAAYACMTLRPRPLSIGLHGFRGISTVNAGFETSLNHADEGRRMKSEAGVSCHSLMLFEDVETMNVISSVSLRGVFAGMGAELEMV